MGLKERFSHKFSKLTVKNMLIWIKDHKIVSIAILLVIVVLFQFVFKDNVASEEVQVKLPEVTLKTVSELDNTSIFSTVGMVEAVAEVQLKAESGGQVTAVYTDLGKYVTAGSILAQFENSRERAALLQAQGAYEAAQASAANSELGVSGATTALNTAKNNALTTYSSAYNTVAGILRTDIDPYFSNPDTALPGLRVNGYGQTGEIISARKQLTTILNTWQNQTRNLNTGSDLEKALNTARQDTSSLLSLVDMLIAAITADNNLTSAEDEEKRTKLSSLTAVRASLLSLDTSLQNTIQSLKSANDALKQANISATNPQAPSLSGAQIKQALGALRAAQASYEKTLVRTPISGVVNVLTIKRGDYIAPMTDVAIVANNKGLQVTTAITESDRERLAIGDVITINNIATGTVTAIAGAVDPKTGKIALKISLPDNAPFTNGTNVNVSFGQSSTATSSELLIPLSAIKLGASGANIFVVDEQSKLVAKSVELGSVTGERVLVKAGLDQDTKFVLDARGLKAGEEVIVTNK